MLESQLELVTEKSRYGLVTDIQDPSIYKRAVSRFRDTKIKLPKFAQLSDPQTIPAEVKNALLEVSIDSAHPLNLFRVHWYNRLGSRSWSNLPDYIELPPELTGVEARIVLLFGDRFPMIRAHKVLAAYACLVPRVVTGQFDPTYHRAVWPSTGNYARGGIAISRIMGCRGVAVLPENMSTERFNWLEKWVANSDDIVRTQGSESNVKEIYDMCRELDQSPENYILNQFSEFSNHIAHYQISGPAFANVFRSLQKVNERARLAAFVAASGSAGTLGTGDYLKDKFGSKIVAVEALECPTMLYNGYGEHNIQGIGDKHIPLIHNVLNTDLAIAVTDKATDGLNIAFNTEVGQEYLVDEIGIDRTIVRQMEHFGLSAIANTLAAIKTAKFLDLDENDIVMAAATDGADLYISEKEKLLSNSYPSEFSLANAKEIISTYWFGADTSHVNSLDKVARERIFNLGYYTWVEQQNVHIHDFELRRKSSFWDQLHKIAPIWDELIERFNREVGIRF
ncbi:MAG: pyridoxal-5'-phosphate-dependent protein subunit beta [Acidiferrobacteraceae bacterium]|nr:pyridoxal-5'-phosphate-dependent protein subunit beta [Acidiferrobacteraceae bacterium]|tara:strand:+ start:4517 stop:6043 length:1527 start_codon:yes stop_codon:yes gene_type:complete